MWKVNTTNPRKQEEFLRFFNNNVLFTNDAIREIDHPDPYLVLRHKVTQQKEDHVIVDDTTLDVENANFGVNIKTLIPKLHDHYGARARFRVLLGFREKGKVHIYEGLVYGRICPPRGNTAFGFNSMFLPDGENQTLGEVTPDRVNPRAIAVKKLLNRSEVQISDLVNSWHGNYQPE